MKTQLATLLLLITAFSAQAESMICHEIYDPAIEVLRTRTIVEVDELSDISNTHPERDNFDTIMKVKVTIKHKLGNKVTVFKKFEAVSKSEDVNYQIISKKDGVHFSVYLDEMEESWIKYNGNKQSVRLSCDYKQN